MKTKMLTGAATLLAAALVLAGCASGTNGTTSSGGGDDSPIRVGAVAMLSGPSTFDDVPDAVKAVFERYNDDGGLDGRKLEYKVVDDQGDPARAATAAKQLVGDDGVLAMVGSSSLMECQVNGDYYEKENVVSLEGVATDPDCFTSPVISSVTAGPYVGTQLSLTYGSESLGLAKICAIIENQGATAPAYRTAITRWSDETGEELAYLDDSLPYGVADYTPYVVKAEQQGCDGVFLGLIEPDALGFLKAATEQGWTDVPFLSLTTVYTDDFATAASGLTGQGLSVAAEFAPFTDPDSPETKDWRDLMTDAGVPLTSFSQAGYVAATVFIQALESIDGEITRESVLDAVRGLDPVDTPLMGNPWEFGHNANHSGWPVTLKPGSTQWEKAADDWIHVSVD